jgi:NAD(P)-dependent dehydrogenase (short-subunit alcohol dehydrogenase family)
MLTAAVESYGAADPQAHLRDSLAQYPQGPHARFVQPEEVAQLVFYLASEAAGPITGAPCPELGEGSSPSTWAARPADSAG